MGYGGAVTSENVEIGRDQNLISKGVFPGGASGKESACQSRRHKTHRFDPGVGNITWRRKWQPTPVFLPGESQGRGSLVGCCLWGRTELDTTEVT